MKKISIIAAVSLLGLNAFAEKTIESNVQAILAPSPVVAVETQVQGEAQISSDLAGILASSRKPVVAAQKLVLQTGHYILQTEGSEGSEKSLFLEKSSNNADNYFALVVDQQVMEKESGLGTLYEGRLVRGGSTLMLSPLVKSASGNLTSASKASGSAPVLMISLKADAKVQKYPYLVQGIHNATNGVLMGMKGGRSNVGLVTNTASYAFNWRDESTRGRGSVIVAGESITINKPGMGDASFVMKRFNGASSGIFTLEKSDFDVQRELDTSKSKIEQVAMFLNVEGSKEDILITGKPITGTGEISLTVYSPQRGPGFLEIFFGKLFGTLGHTAPTK